MQFMPEGRYAVARDMIQAAQEREISGACKTEDGRGRTGCMPQLTTIGEQISPNRFRSVWENRLKLKGNQM